MKPKTERFIMQISFFLFSILFILTLAHFSSGALSTNLQNYWDADGVTCGYDEVGGNANFTAQGTAACSAAGKIGQGFAVPGGSDTGWFNTTNSGAATGATPGTICAWFNTTSVAAGGKAFLDYGTNADGQARGFQRDAATLKSYRYVNDQTYTGVTLIANTYFFACDVYNGTASLFYYNGTNTNNYTTTLNTGNTNLYLGKDKFFANAGFTGTADEIGVWNRTLTAAEISELYNGGSGRNYNYISGGGGVYNTINVTLTNNITGQNIGSYVTFSNVTGDLTFSYFNITTAGFCVTYTGNGTSTNCTASNGASTFFNISKNQTITTTEGVTTSTYQANLNITAYRLFLNTSITTFNGTNNQTTNQTTITNLILKALNGTNNIRIDTPGNYSLNVTCTVLTPLTTINCNATGIYDNNYGFNATDAFNNIGIQNFSLLITNQTLGGLLYNSTTTNGLLNFSLLQGYTYFIQFSTPNATYEYFNVSLAANTSNQKYTFEVLPAPSIDITIRDITTNAIITENITIQLISNTTSQTNYTTTGGFFYQNIAPGTYTVKLENANYSQSVYTITPSIGTVYYLTAYLQYAPQTVTMQFVDSIATSVVLSNVAVTQERVVNGSWQVISSKTTDITGRTTFRYANDVAYRFSAVVTNYASKTFTLDPVLFDSYQIKMVKNTALTFEEDFQSVYLSYTPQFFYNGQLNHMNITFNSPLGTFLSYSYNVSYPGGNRIGNGTNTVGETFPINLTITGAQYTDKVNVTLTYDTGIGNPRGFNYTSTIYISPGNTTFIANVGNTYGLGLLERILIGTIIIIIVAGLVTLAGGTLFGLIMGLFLMGLWIYIGFWPWWAAGISFLAGFIIISGRTN